MTFRFLKYGRMCTAITSSLAVRNNSGRRNNNLNRKAHTLKVMFAKKRRHRRSGNGSRFPFKERMVTLFVTATVVRVMLIIVMQKGNLSAHWARRILPPTICPLRPRAFGCKLMMAVPAEILLITVRIFAVTIKRMIVVAFWAHNVV